MLELKNRYTHIDFKNEDSKNVLNNSKYFLEELAIININKNSESVKQEEIAKLTKKSIRIIKMIIKNRQEKGLIKRTNRKRNAKWIIL